MIPRLRSAFALLSCCSFLALATACGGSETPQAKTADSAPEQEDDDGLRGVQVGAEIGGMNEDAVDQAFTESVGGLQRCLNQGSKRVEFLGGSVSFFLKINLEGKVEHAHLERSTLGDRATEKCMIDALRKRNWPKPVGGEHGLARKSFDFDPPNDVRPPTEWSSEEAAKGLEKLDKQLAECGGRRGFEATVYVDTDGAVLAAGATPPDEAGEEKVDCIVDTLKGASFPSPGSWPAKVTLSL
jgi:hypothetical protein